MEVFPAVTMKIKRLDILGFKSFVEKTSIDFESGITGIVGPNGCGKSNIVDAIRWCLGEQGAKNLRGRSMEDVIFSGSERRKPLSMAEVSLTFSNEDGSAPSRYRDLAEITVTRRLYRSGESEYLINKAVCRLLDIVELVMDTGVGARAYSIIEQGKIGQILSARPEERRFLIEEAAGISKFKARKKSALRKIDATRHNLERIGDILSEVRRQMAGLKRQAQKAERFRACREEIKALEVRFAQERYAELVAAITLAEERLREVECFLEEETLRLSECDTRLEEHRLLQDGEEADLQQIRTRILHLDAECRRLEQTLEFAAREQQQLVGRCEQLKAELQEGEAQLRKLETEREDLGRESEELGQVLDRERLGLTMEESRIREFADQSRTMDARMEEERHALFATITELSLLSSHQDEVARRLGDLDERERRNRSDAVSIHEQMGQKREHLEALQQTLQNDHAEFSRLTAELDALRSQREQLQAQMEEYDERLLVLREALSRKQSRLESLQELEKNLSGYSDGVRTLLGDPVQAARFAGMAADFLDVPQALETAVEAATGERLQALLLNHAEDARAAVSSLQGGAGRATFLLPDVLPPLLSGPGEGIALAEQVGLRAGAPLAAANLLAGVYLVESLEPYLAEPLPAGILLVTRSGETLNFRGEYAGGVVSEPARGVLHKKREVAELSRDLVGEQALLAELQVVRERQRSEKGAVESRLQELGGYLHQVELRSLSGRKELERFHADLARLEERLEVLSFEEDQVHEERERLQAQHRQSTSRQGECTTRRQQLEQSLAELQDRTRNIRRELAVQRDALTARKVALAASEERERNSRKRLEQLGQLHKDLELRRERAKLHLAEGDQRRTLLQEEQHQAAVRIELLHRKRAEEKTAESLALSHCEERRERIREQEALLKSLRERLDEHQRRQSALHLKIRELAMEAEHVRSRCLELHRVDLDALSEPAAPLDVEAARRRLDDLRRQVEAMGEVNLMAIEQFEELDQRHQFLSSQQEDLRHSMEDLHKAIQKINRTTRSRFRDTFDQINAQFQTVFPRLFRGGRAELVLTDEQDLLETGVDIIVQPPGKKLQNISLLSGGEKALAATALIFSIFLIKPSPFCLLDEVDAPLDDANIGRFNEMILEMSHLSQFIIITHNKKTMEIADPLYGVTMEEPGISRIVSVRMTEL